MARRISDIASIILACTAALAAQTFPAPPAPTTAETLQFGGRIQRTMNLLATSTPQKRNTVKILVYGQSISKQGWSRDIAAWLKATYPNANIIIRNDGIGGCASQCLIAPAEHDIYPFYPDLVLFHVYGANGEYEQIVRATREKTTAEMLLQTDHYTGADSWSDQMSYTFVPQYANTYQCGLANIRDPWKRYLTANGYQPSRCLLDGVHLNAQGCYLMAELIKRSLIHKPSLASDPNGLVKEYRVGSDINWSGSGLTMRFAGNRVDLVFDNSGTPGARATVQIDGARPSTYPSLYTFTRPNGSFGAEWISDSTGLDWPWECGAIMRVTSNTPRLVEDWTATITSFTSGTNFAFRINGSRTGLDGNGTYGGADPFVSTSGRVVIKRSDWWMSNMLDTTIRAGHTITWRCVPNFADTAVVPTMPDPTLEYTLTLAQGLTNADHTLTLNTLGGGTLPVKAVRVYRPYYGRAATTVPDPVPVSVERSSVSVAAAERAPAPAAVYYSLLGQRIDVRPGKRQSGGVVIQTGTAVNAKAIGRIAFPK